MALGAASLNDLPRGQAGAKLAGGPPEIGDEPGAGGRAERGSCDGGQPDRGRQTRSARLHRRTACEGSEGQARSAARIAAIRRVLDSVDQLAADRRSASSLRSSASVRRRPGLGEPKVDRGAPDEYDLVQERTEQLGGNLELQRAQRFSLSRLRSRRSSRPSATWRMRTSPALTLSSRAKISPSSGQSSTASGAAGCSGSIAWPRSRPRA